jgi:hypothetical protein
VWWGLRAARITLVPCGNVPRGRLIIVSNQLPVRVKRGASGAWEFEWDEDALVAQAKVRHWCPHAHATCT